MFTIILYYIYLPKSSQYLSELKFLSQVELQINPGPATIVFLNAIISISLTGFTLLRLSEHRRG